MDAWKQAAQEAANVILRDPEKISDGLESELYALLEQIDCQQGITTEIQRKDA
jgi:hypothetical protein